MYVYFSRQNSHISYKFIISNYSICRFLLNPFLRLQFIPNFFGVCASVCTKNEYIWYSEVKKKIELTSLERHSAIFNIYYITRSFLLSSQRYFPLRNLLWDIKRFFSRYLIQSDKACLMNWAYFFLSQTNILTWKSTYAYSKPVIPSIKLLVNNAWMANQLIYIQHGIWTYNGCQPCDDARQLQKTVGCYKEKARHLIGIIFDPVLLLVSIYS